MVWNNDYSNWTAFRVSILQAFAQVGDNTVLSIVERLATGETRTAGQKRIQEAARECLPALQKRIAQQNAQSTLLRASQAVADDPDMLLRPAQGGEATDPQQLLRASATPHYGD